eukprot:5619809-Ditylum_brightwellii.AAC.1
MRGTQYASFFKPFQQVKNGRGALASIKQQFSGADKWQSELSLSDKFLHSAEQKGQMLYPLESLLGSTGMLTSPQRRQQGTCHSNFPMGSQELDSCLLQSSALV